MDSHPVGRAVGATVAKARLYRVEAAPRIPKLSWLTLSGMPSPITRRCGHICNVLSPEARRGFVESLELFLKAADATWGAIL